MGPNNGLLPDDLQKISLEAKKYRGNAMDQPLMSGRIASLNDTFHVVVETSYPPYGAKIAWLEKMLRFMS
jgi:hypothetical protein